MAAAVHGIVNLLDGHKKKKKKEYTILPLSVDLIKAFLIVGYIILLSELLSMGYDDCVCTCLRSYIPVRMCAAVAFSNTFPPKNDVYLFFTEKQPALCSCFLFFLHGP